GRTARTPHPGPAPCLGPCVRRAALRHHEFRRDAAVARRRDAIVLATVADRAEHPRAHGVWHDRAGLRAPRAARRTLSRGRVAASATGGASGRFAAWVALRHASRMRARWHPA